MNFNFLAVALAALIPIIMGFVWYHPKLFGNTWMKLNNFTEEQLKASNMALIFGVSLLLSFLLAFDMNFIVVHQYHVYSILVDVPGFDDPNSEIGKYIADFMTNYGNNYRTFKHGAFHGALASIFFALPILGINSLFERRGFKYIAIHFGYWFMCLMLMGGIVCAWI
ncbi:MAG: DUF1761 domain-containing protein [Chitinophagales bacterium]|nr:DUF1761 domain-containing protein [Erysipelotrichaceae bacterium]